MSGETDVNRRAVLRGSAVALGLTGVGSVSAADGTDAVDWTLERVPTLDVTHAEDDLETVDPAVGPPEQSWGIGPGSMLFVTREDSSGTAGCTANFVWRGPTARSPWGRPATACPGPRRRRPERR
jgi:hypothetical protein